MKRLLEICCLVVLVLLSSCRSSQGLTEGKSGSKTTQIEETYKAKILANEQQAACVTGKMQIDLNFNGKNIGVGGRLRMRRDQAIQMSLTLLGFEVARMEFMPNEVLIIDRANKQFVRAAYQEVSFLRAAQLDFYALQALFWNELFIPGEREANGQLSRFQYKDVGNMVQLLLHDAPKLNYTFLTQKDNALLNQVDVVSKEGVRAGKLRWTYDQFVQLDRRYFPSQMSCNIEALGKQVGFSLSLSRLNNDEGWEAQTKISSRYKERKAEEILDRLMSM